MAVPRTWVRRPPRTSSPGTSATMPTHQSHRSRPRAARTAVVTGVVAAVLVVTGATGAAAGTPTAPTAPTAAPAPTGPTAPALAADAEHAERRVREHEAAAAGAEERLAQLTATAATHLEAHQTALRARDEALRAHREQAARWEAAQVALHDAQGQVARWTSQAHRHGVAASGVAGFVAVTEARSPDDLQQRVAVLSQVGRAEARVLAGASHAQESEAEATLAAERTAREALRTAAEAQSSKAASDASLAAARDHLRAVQGLLASSRDTAAAARTMTDTVLAPAVLRSGAAALPGCSGSDLSGFGNGRVPAEALCPLPGAPGQALRSDAAAAFAQLSAAYERGNGQPLCVTDSYRDLDSQVALRAAKPGLAAVPGTSNHGWGVALDLCGGVQHFGSPQHEWMRVNAPLFGWFHPAWARQGGGKPEAWHWEFAG